MRNSPTKITPKLAAKWLTKNTTNRPLSQRTVDSYAAAMVAGEWHLNGDTVRFDRNGNLIDGQHRLHACVKSGKSFLCYVVTDLPPEAFDTIDQGRPRTLSDVLARRGEKHYSTLASALRMLWRLQNGTMTFNQESKLRPQVMDTLLDANPGIRDGVAAARETVDAKGPAIIGVSTIAVLWYLFNQIKPQKNREFWSRVMEGIELTKTMPEYILRRRLLSNATSQAKLSNEVICALVIKTWNAASVNKPLQHLRWQDNEDFPKILGGGEVLKIVKAS